MGKRLGLIFGVVHEAVRGVDGGIVSAPVGVPSFPVPLLGVVAVNPNVIHGGVESGGMVLEPLPLEGGVRDDEARLVVESPSLVQLGVPQPEPLPEVNVLLSPGDPGQILSNVVLLVLTRENVDYPVFERAIRVVGPHGLFMVAIALTREEIIDIARPNVVIFMLALGFVPGVPVLGANEFIVDVMISVALFPTIIAVAIIVIIVVVVVIVVIVRIVVVVVRVVA